MKNLFSTRSFIIAAIFMGFLFGAETVWAATEPWYHCIYDSSPKIAFSAIKSGTPYNFDIGNGPTKGTVKSSDDATYLMIVLNESYDSDKISCKTFNFDDKNCKDNSECPLGYACNSFNNDCEAAPAGFQCNALGFCEKTVAANKECVCGGIMADTACKSAFCTNKSSFYCYNETCQTPPQPPQGKPKPNPSWPGSGPQIVAECVITGKMLPALPGTAEDAAAVWKELGYADVQCTQSEINLLKCATSDDCAIGSFCYTNSMTGNKQCKLLATEKNGCTTDADCQTDFAFGGGSESKKMAYHCDVSTGVCLYHVDTECECPYGDSLAIKGYCNSPFCPIVGEFGVPGSLGCNSKSNSCEKLSTVLEEACDDHLDCWKGTGSVLFEKMKCCVNKKCAGKIEDCYNVFKDQGECPPGYRLINTTTGCVYDCPASKNQCKTDEDCKKGGQNKFCVDITKKSSEFQTDADVKMWACQKLGVTKQCEFKAQSTIPPAESYIPAPFVLPSIAGLNQLGSTDVKKIIGNAIWKLMGVMGSIALALFVYAGVIMMIGSTSVSGGATKKDVLKAKAIMVWAVLGMLVIFASYAIVNFVFEAFK